MTPKMAMNIIKQQTDWNKSVVLLARLLSPAAVIETELIRTMRLLAMPGVEAGAEADLYFSPLVMARDPSAIAFIPAVREALHEDLRYHQDQLRMAGDIIKNAHKGMDPAILLEEAATYYALSEESGGYQSMQRQIGSVVRELTQPSVDPDILSWATRSFEDLPPRARHSDAGKEFKRLINGHLSALRKGMVRVLEVRRKRDTVQVGYQVTFRGVTLSAPPPKDWQQFTLPGPLPTDATVVVVVEIGWPVAEGWKTESLEVTENGKPALATGTQPGLLRFRGDGGDEIRIRPSGPFENLQPRLLILHTSPTYDPKSIRDELHDLDWMFEQRHHLTPGSGDVVVIHSASKQTDRDRLNLLIKELKKLGFNPWFDLEHIKPGGHWQQEIERAISNCRGAIVLLSPDALQSDFFVRELVLLGERRRVDPGFFLQILVSKDLDMAKASSMLPRNTGLSEVQFTRWEDDIAALTSRVTEHLRPKPVTLSSVDACLIDFNTLEGLEEYLQSMQTVGSTEDRFDGLLDGSVAASLPIIVRAGDRIGRLPYDKILDSESNTSDPAKSQNQRVTRALQHIQGDWNQKAFSENEEQQLRALLLSIERDAIAGWLLRTDAKEETTPKKICFVILGFGEKTDYKTGRTLDLDASYDVIKEAVENAGMTPVRGDEMLTSGIIDKPVFEMLLNADLVIADLSTSNINTAYQLGIRHALCRRGTIIVAEKQWDFSLDIRNLILTYKHWGTDISSKEARRFSAELAEAIKAKLDDDNFVDSPVYKDIPQLAPPALPEPDALISEDISTKASKPDKFLSPEAKGKASRYCFVVQEFGQKTVFPTGRQLDLDASYRVIEGSVDNAGLRCIRLDETQHPQIIDNQILYENLLNADLVIADLSTSNFNTAYQLGMRHALCRRGTIIVAESQWDFSLNINPRAIRTYEHLGPTISRSEGRIFSTELTKAIKAVLDDENVVDSPLYYFLPELIPPEPTGYNPFAEEGNSVKKFTDQARNALEISDFMTAKTMYKAALDIRPNDPSILQKLARATYMSGLPSETEALWEAHDLIQKKLDPKRTNDPETIDLWATVHKQLWQLTNDSEHMEISIETLEHGFNKLKNSYYFGINLAYMLNERAALADTKGDDSRRDFARAQDVRWKVIEICKKYLAEGIEDNDQRYWVLATLWEASAGVFDKEGAERWKAEALQHVESYNLPPRMVETTEHQLAKLRELLALSPLDNMSEKS